MAPNVIACHGIGGDSCPRIARRDDRRRPGHRPAREVDHKTNEITVFRPMLVGLDLADTVVTFDALHSQTAHARFLVQDKKAHYIAMIKANQPLLHQRLKDLPWRDVPLLGKTRATAHGRDEIRRVKTVTVTDLDFPHAAQAVQIVRRRRTLSTGKESGGDLGQGFVLAQVHQGDQGTLVRGELAAAVTLAGDDEHGDPLDQRMREVEYGRMANQRGTCADELRLRIPPSTARVPRALRPRRRHPIGGHSETAHWAIPRQLQTRRTSRHGSERDGWPSIRPGERHSPPIGGRPSKQGRGETRI